MTRRRLRVTFSQTGDLRFLSHLDLVTLWQRALRRAGVPVLYSQGFNPQPRLAFAAALPVGHIGWKEAFDVWLEDGWSPEQFAKAMVCQLPAGVDLREVWEVPLDAPSLQSQVVAAQYRVWVPCDEGEEALQDRLRSLLAQTTLTWKRTRRGREETFDLRPLVLEMRLEGCTGGLCTFWMRLRAGQRGSLRPEDVVRALTLPEPERIERLALELSERGSHEGALL
ncbi:MAG: TIGR03936 family radical SAM-associated protein [Anaerolineae bacterium]